MTTIGTPLCDKSTRLLLLGSGELGKEVALEAQRFGIEVIAIDRYANAPAMQVAHRSHVIDMLDPDALVEVIHEEQPNLIVPEIEAIATHKLVELEEEGYRVIPTAKAARLTMDREGIRRLAAEELGIKTSPYRFADTEDEYREALEVIGIPCVIKPVMSSSGKGQSVVRDSRAAHQAWQYAQEGGRTQGGRVIVEGFVEFDYEITLLTVRHGEETSFCLPIGHRQVDGDYRESWQPQPMSETALGKARKIAAMVTGQLGGRGIFGVELFVKDEDIYFSEVSPRPHDTGMVTMISQDLSQFALHVRAILGLPIPGIRQYGAAASHVLIAEGTSKDVQFRGVDKALSKADTALRLFGKPEVKGKRRMGVALALGDDLDHARAKAQEAAEAVRLKL